MLSENDVRFKVRLDIKKCCNDAKTVKINVHKNLYVVYTYTFV